MSPAPPIHDVAYVQVFGRLFTFEVLDGYPVDRSGRECKCHLDWDAQSLRVTARVSIGQRQRLVARAFGWGDVATAWSLTPVGGLALAPAVA